MVPEATKHRDNVGAASKADEGRLASKAEGRQGDKAGDEDLAAMSKSNASN